MIDPYPIKASDRPFSGAPRLPGSKSITNRALTLAAMADGVSTLERALFSDDTDRMAAALTRLGIPVHAEHESARLIVQGCAGRIPAAEADLDVGNAGTAARFLTALAALGEGHYRLDGSARMRERPIEPLLAALRALGSDARSEAGTGCPPVSVRGRGLDGGLTTITADSSSQYLSGLLMAAPYARADVTIAVDGELASEPYVTMTVRMMQAWGLTVNGGDASNYHVPAPQRVSGRVYAIEPDASAASYFLAAAAVTGGTVHIRGLGSSSLQGDVRFIRVLERAGCSVSVTADRMSLTGPRQLGGVTEDMNDISDTVITLAAVAPFMSTPTRITNVAHIRHKECDRIAALVTELERLGVRAAEHADGVTIYPGRPHAGAVETYDDHRMAMSFAVTGLRTPGLTIRNPACVSKTFPGFFEELERIQLAEVPMPG